MNSLQMLPQDIQKAVRKLITKAKTFNTVYDTEDYMQEAVLAYILNRNRHQLVRNGKETKMKESTVLYWHIENAINRLADTGEVVYEIYDECGNYVETLSNKQFRKKRKEIEKKGYTWRSVNVMERLYAYDGDEEREREIPFYYDFDRNLEDTGNGNGLHLEE